MNVKLYLVVRHDVELGFFVRILRSCKGWAGNEDVVFALSSFSFFRYY